MSALLDKIRSEPVLVTTFVGAVLVLLVQAGVPISDGLANAITGVVVAALAFVARGKVTPLRRKPEPGPLHDSH